jgi:hypothetical protein
MHKRIAVQMSGRLGNQLFQWAFGHKLAIYYGKKIYPLFDKLHEQPEYESNIDVATFPCTHVDSAVKRNMVGYGLALLDKIGSKNQHFSRKISWNLRILRAKDYNHLPEFPKFTPRLVTGFFLNWKSVEGVEDILVKELETALAKLTLPGIISGDYQLLHVRRGDFVALRDSFGVLSKEYYVKHLVTNLPTYICTDDDMLVPDIAQATNAIKVFGPKDLKPVEVLNLMSRASVLIMSNSTLSWWGGFLCINNSGTAYLPKPFYKYLNSSNTTFEHPKFKKIESIFEN